MFTSFSSVSIVNFGGMKDISKNKKTDMILKYIVSIGSGIHFRNIRMCLTPLEVYGSISNCVVDIIFLLKKQFVRVVKYSQFPNFDKCI